MRHLLEVAVVDTLAALVPHLEHVLVVHADQLSQLLCFDLVDDSAQIVGFVGGNASLEFVQRVQRDLVGCCINEVTRRGGLIVEHPDV